jgi:hypothetical protein
MLGNSGERFFFTGSVSKLYGQRFVHEVNEQSCPRSVYGDVCLILWNSEIDSASCTFIFRLLIVKNCVCRYITLVRWKSTIADDVFALRTRTLQQGLLLYCLVTCRNISNRPYTSAQKKKLGLCFIRSVCLYEYIQLSSFEGRTNMYEIWYILDHASRSQFICILTDPFFQSVCHVCPSTSRLHRMPRNNRILGHAIFYAVRFVWQDRRLFPTFFFLTLQ